jgi:hypothetical protein
LTPGSLWRNHEATPSQQYLIFARRKQPERLTQADLLLGMLCKAREFGRAVELPEIMQAGIAQHGARISELRERGFLIENDLERLPDGRVLSRYWLRHDPEQDSRP